MWLNPFGRRRDAHALAVSMAGIKLGDRLLQIGCPDGGRLAALAAKVGLTGRAGALAETPQAAEAASRAALKAGVLVECQPGTPGALPYDENSFDVVVIDDTGGILTHLSALARGTCVAEVRRVLRAGGRVVIVGGTARRGLGSVMGAHAVRHDPAATTTLLQNGGFRAPRTLAARDGLVFLEAMKPRN